MGVVWIEEQFKDEARASRDALELTRYFRAQTSHVRDGIRTLLLARPDLAPFQRHPELLLAFVDSFEPVRIEGSLLWDITVHYSTKVDGEEEDDNPLARPAKVSWGTAEFSRIALIDEDGKPTINTAGDLIDDPPFEVEDSRWVISVEKNIPTRLPTWILDYPNAVNADSVRIKGLVFGPRTLKLKGLAISDEQVENNVRFCVLGFQLHYNPEGWTRKTPNRGFYERVPGDIVANKATGVGLVKNWKRRPILINGEPASEPQMLDREGRLIKNPTPDNIVILEFNFEKRRPFSVLPLK